MKHTHNSLFIGITLFLTTALVGVAAAAPSHQGPPSAHPGNGQGKAAGPKSARHMRNQHHQEVLGKFDVNRDGKLSADEEKRAKKYIVSQRAAKFDNLLRQFDINGDKKLSKVEIRKMIAKKSKIEKRTSHADKRSRIMGLFARIDTNQDGLISKREFKLGKVRYRGNKAALKKSI